MKFYLAPLKGYTDSLYQNLFLKHFDGVDLIVTPFIGILKHNGYKQSIFDRVISTEHNKKVVPQIIGKNSESFVILADILFNMGYKEINWNLGCSHKPVLLKKHGAGALKYPSMIDDILNFVTSNMKGDLSIKIRLGVENFDDVDNLIPIFNRYPLKEIIVHPRVATQWYNGVVNLDKFEQILPKIDHKIVYNGDITTPKFIEDIVKRFDNIDNFMIGRGLVQNPFLIEDILGNSSKKGDKKDRFYNFYKEIYNNYKERFYSDKTLLNRIKGFWQYPIQSFKGGEKFYKKLKKIESLKKFENHIERFFIETEWIDRY